MTIKKSRNLSFSALRAYDFCPANWLGTNELKMAGTEFVPNPESAVGKAVHRVMKRLNEKRMDGAGIFPAQLTQWAKDYWKEEKSTLPDHVSMSEAAYQDYERWSIIHSSALAAKTRGHKPQLIEKYLSMPLIFGDGGDVFWYIGCIVDVVTDPVVVYDFKTLTNRSLNSRDRETYRSQAAINSAVTRHHLNLDTYPDVHLIFSDDNATEDWLVPLTETTIEDTLDHAKRVAREIDRLLETGTPFPRGKSCRFCPAQGNCPQTIGATVAA